ncbi:uncharacterized protein LOC142795288 [Rhipicephalus microplus]
MMGLLSAEAKKLENQARFILEKIDNLIKIENRRRKEMILTLRERGYDPDPIAEWKKQQTQQEDKQDSQDDEEDEDKDEDKDGGSASYNYLLGMPLWSLTRERKEDLLSKRDQKRAEVETLRRKTPENLWEEDLDVFMTKLDEVEKAERDDESSTGAKAAGLKLATSKGGRVKGSSSKKMEAETQPSPFGERVEPKVDWEAKRKTEKGAGPGRKPKKSLEEGKSEGGGGDDEGGAPPKPPRKRAPKGTGEKKRTPKKRRNSWSGSDSSDEQSVMSFGSDDEERPKIPPERQTSRRAALARPKYKVDDSDEEDDDDDMGETRANEGVLEDVEESRPSEPTASTEDGQEDGQENGRVRSAFDSDSDSNLEPLTKRLSSQGGKDNSEVAFDSLFGGGGSASGSKATASHKKAGSGSANEPSAAPKPAPKKAPAKRKPPAQSDSDASDVEEEFKPKKAPAARKPAAPKKKPARSGSDGSDMDDDFKPKKAAPARKPAAPKSRKKKATDSDSDGARKKPKPAKKSKKAASSDDDDDDKMSDKDVAASVAPRLTTGRTKAPVKYNFGSDSSDDDF